MSKRITESVKKKFLNKIDLIGQGTLELEQMIGNWDLVLFKVLGIKKFGNC